MISVVTPSYNMSDWLRCCVASVADQNGEHEHIVQDGGSTDGTCDWAKSDRRIWFTSESDDGMYDALNRAISRARGDVILHLNCDEQLLPGALTRVERCFERHPEIDVLCADAVVVDGVGQFVSCRKVILPRRWMSRVHTLPVLTCATFIRRAALERRRLRFDTSWKVLGDKVWIMSMIDAGMKMMLFREFTSVFTLTGDNLMASERGRAEMRRYRDGVPLALRFWKPFFMAEHRLLKAFYGCYRQEPFTYAIYRRQDPSSRKEFTVKRPSTRFSWGTATEPA